MRGDRSALVQRDSVLDCGSPLPLWDGARPLKSARGLAQSKTLRRFRRFVETPVTTPVRCPSEIQC